MNISENGKKLIKSFEGLRLKAYKVIDTEKYFTIGFGHYGADVLQNMIITEGQADKLFDADIKKYVKAVNDFNFLFNVNQNEFDALVSFCYNLGPGILHDFINLTSEEIAKEMPKYVYSGKIKLEGLVIRRKLEVELYERKEKNIEYIIKEYNEMGIFYPNDKIYFRNYPKISYDYPTMGSYIKGENVIYDKVVITSNYVYISWISVLTGIRRYMPIRENDNGNLKPLWGFIK